MGGKQNFTAYGVAWQHESMRFHDLLAVALAVLSAPLVARAQDLGSAKSFVAALYQDYDQREPDYLGRDAQATFDKQLVRLIRGDRSRTPSGYVGALDWDPICGCQDPAGLKLVDLSVKRTGASSAQAIAYLRFAPDGTREIRLDLTFSSAGWRVSDVHDREVTSLVAFLRRERR